MKNKVFISYAHDDYYDSSGNVIKGSAVDRILSTLDQNEVDYWMDEKILPGNTFSQDIGEAIAECDIFVFISSARSNESSWAAGEIHAARELRKRIVPIRIDTSAYNNGYLIYLSPLDHIDYQANPQKALEDLIKVISHNQVNIRIPFAVKQKDSDDVLKVGQDSLSKKVFLLFSSITVDNATDQLLSVFDYYGSLGVKFSDSVQKIHDLLSNIASFVNLDVKRKKLLDITTFADNTLLAQKRINKFLVQLTQMVIYFWLDEANAVLKLQSDISNTEFKKTWWEDNGADIVSVVAGIGGFLASLRGPGIARNTSIAIMRYSPSVSNENQENLKRQQRLFNGFKDAIKSIEFYT